MTERLGQQLGNYKVIRSIGQGSFADIYLGEHIYLKTQVAIKVLKEKIANENALEDFLQEARTIAHLVHPHIVRVLDFGIDDQAPFLVMDYAPYGTLRQRHAKGTQVPLGCVVSYARQVAAALQYAHDEKLIHRDVKPENMLLGKHNDVLLSDFGIALVTQSSRYQDTQDVIGTLAYMSPEQLQGKARRASDQYSLAIVIYEWLCGERPFRGSFTELCAQQMLAVPPSLREKVPTIAPEVERVIMTALAKDPEQRFESMQAFADALEQAYQTTEAVVLTSKPVVSSVTTVQAAASAQVTVAPQAVLPLQNDEIDTPHVNLTAIEAVPTAPVIKSPDVEPVAVELEEQAGPDKKTNMWNLAIRQILAMITGIILCAGLGFGAGQRLPASISFIPEFLVAIIFGILFGPLVGLVSGGAGISLLEPVAGPLVYVGFALTGFIAGLAKLISRGRYNTFLRFAVAEIFGVMGMLISLSLIFYCVYVFYTPHPDLGLALNRFIIYGSRGAVATLILLPLILGINNLLVWWLQGRSS